MCDWSASRVGPIRGDERINHSSGDGVFCLATTLPSLSPAALCLHCTHDHDGDDVDHVDDGRGDGGGDDDHD